MTKLKNLSRLRLNQRGFTGLEIVLVIVAISAIGAAGYFAWQSKTPAKVDQPASAPKKVEQKPVDPYAGWSTFKASMDTLSFKYPKDWKLSHDLKGEGNFEESITLKAPSGLGLYYFLEPSGLGGGCDGCKTQIHASNKVTGISGQEVYYAELTLFTPGEKERSKSAGLVSTKSVESFRPVKNAIVDPIGWSMYENPSGKSVWVHSEYDPDAKEEDLSDDDYFNLPDVKTAAQILKSFKY